MTSERAICPVCGREFTLTRTGLIRHHLNKNLTRHNHIHYPVCAGAGKHP